MPGLNDFLSRIQTDYAFYLQFRQNAEEALAPYELSAEERAALTESGSQLWARVQETNPSAGSAATDTKPDANLKPIIHTTQVGWIQIEQLNANAAEFNPDGVFKRTEIRQSVTNVHEETTEAGRLAAILKLMEHIG